jgi:hypothetical protein
VAIVRGDCKVCGDASTFLAVAETRDSGRNWKFHRCFLSEVPLYSEITVVRKDVLND